MSPNDDVFERCKNCYYYKRIDRNEIEPDHEIGECRCLPPVQHSGVVEAQFPIVCENLWCGSFEAVDMDVYIMEPQGTITFEKVEKDKE